MATSKGGGPSGTVMPTKKGRGPGTLRGSQKPDDSAMAPVHTGKSEIRLRNKNDGFAGVYRDREDKPVRGGNGKHFGGG